MTDGTIELAGYRTLQIGRGRVDLREPYQAATPTQGRLLLSPESVFTKQLLELGSC
jgi:hypothetical protein